ncbi:unnamed protein product, partial [Ectocarpus sp. 6 AP-2014]
QGSLDRKRYPTAFFCTPTVSRGGATSSLVDAVADLARVFQWWPYTHAAWLESLLDLGLRAAWTNVCAHQSIPQEEQDVCVVPTNAWRCCACYIFYADMPPRCKESPT